jgi:AcrR family transcriptional regulator
MNGPRLSRVDRRRQLLDTALKVIRQEGTQALTLAHVAEVAGVSKPVAYEHFETRDGLLRALYLHLDSQQSDRFEAALQAGPLNVTDLAALFSEVFIDCAVQSGPEYAAIEAALEASYALSAFRLDLRETYLATYRKALVRILPGELGGLDPVILALHGAASQLAEEVTSGRMDQQVAVAALIRVVSGALSAVQAEHYPS